MAHNIAQQLEEIEDRIDASERDQQQHQIKKPAPEHIEIENLESSPAKKTALQFARLASPPETTCMETLKGAADRFKSGVKRIYPGTYSVGLAKHHESGNREGDICHP